MHLSTSRSEEYCALRSNTMSPDHWGALSATVQLWVNNTPDVQGVSSGLRMSITFPLKHRDR